MIHSVAGDVHAGDSMMRPSVSVRSVRLGASALMLGLALTLGGCIRTSGLTTGSIAPDARLTPEQWQMQVDRLGPAYEKNSADKKTALAYARALRAVGRNAQATAVLESLAVRYFEDKEILAAFGKSLTDVGRAEQAQDVLSRAHSPDKPDWTILSAQGVASDQLGDHERAQALYRSALEIMPNDADVLANLGLSLALSNKLAEAEATLRPVVEKPGALPRARQNLAMVLAMRGKRADALALAAQDMPLADAEKFIDSVAPKKKLATNSWSALGVGSAETRPSRRTLSAVEGVE
jgi:Flp pilus assembly protein TadD